MQQLVRLWERPSKDGKKFTYYLLYTDDQGIRRQESLGHCDKRKAERQRAKFERHIRIGDPRYMTLEDFTDDSLTRTGDQIRESTHREYRGAMVDIIKVVGNVDCQDVSLKDAELYRQRCLDTAFDR